MSVALLKAAAERNLHPPDRREQNVIIIRAAVTNGAVAAQILLESIAAIIENACMILSEDGTAGIILILANPMAM